MFCVLPPNAMLNVAPSFWQATILFLLTCGLKLIQLARSTEHTLLRLVYLFPFFPGLWAFESRNNVILICVGGTLQKP